MVLLLARTVAAQAPSAPWGAPSASSTPPAGLPSPTAPAPGTPWTEAEAAPAPERAIRGLFGVWGLIPFGPAANPNVPKPGEPPRRGRPRPGSIFDPGAAGPGISQSSNENFLDGALDPRTGWPLVFLDHFQPRPDRVARFWIVQTRDCPQEMGTEPWPCLKVLHFGARGELEPRDLRELLAQTIGRPVLIQVQGSLTTPDIALGGMLWTHTWLEHNKALIPEAVVIAFDWPSQRVYSNDIRDINEKGRRAFVAAYHLARFVQAFPPESRICLLGQSYGGRVVPSALHLLGGGCLNSMSHDPPVRLPAVRSDLHLMGVIVAGASDHNWLDPSGRLDRALVACEGFLNLYNRRDEALRFYRFLIRSDHHRALGRLGLTDHDFEELGPLAARYTEHDVHDELGREHTLLDAVANPHIARLLAPYLFNPNPEPAPEQAATATRDIQIGRGLRGRGPRGLSRRR